MDIEIRISFQDAENIAKAIDAIIKLGFDYVLPESKGNIKEIIIKGAYSGDISKLINTFSENIVIKKNLQL